MKTLPSKLFPNCMFSKGEDAIFDGLRLPGFHYPVSLYLSAETTLDTHSVENAAAFFDQAVRWDALCRKEFLAFPQGSEESELIEEYCKFFREEFPKDLGEASKRELIKRLRFKGMASHEKGAKQRLVADFTLGYHQVLCAQFDSRCQFTGVCWDS